MTTHTKRDLVWSAALQLAATGKFDVEDVLRVAELDDASERTGRDVLATMTDMGHLHQGSEHDRSGGRSSYPPVWCAPEQIESQRGSIRMMEWSKESRHSDT